MLLHQIYTMNVYMHIYIYIYIAWLLYRLAFLYPRGRQASLWLYHVRACVVFALGLCTHWQARMRRNTCYCYVRPNGSRGMHLRGRAAKYGTHVLTPSAEQSSLYTRGIREKPTAP